MQLGRIEVKYRKLLVTKPWVVEVCEDEIDLNDIPADNIAIKTRYTLISTGTELACLSGKESWFKLPDTPGYISVGEIVAKGRGVNNVKIRDIIFHYGQHSEYIIMPKDNFFIKVPDGLDERHALFGRITSIAMTALRVSDIELGDYVAVTGLGLVGNMAGQLAKLQGGNVIGIDIIHKRLEISHKCGIEFCINSNGKVKDKIMEITQSQGVSTLIEATGSSKVIIESLPLIAKGGEIILLGSPREEYQCNITDVLNYCHLSPRGCITFKGAHEWRYPIKHDNFVKHSIERNTRIIFDLMKKGRLLVKPLITHVVKPDEAASAYEGLRDKKDEYIGVVIDWK